MTVKDLSNLVWVLGFRETLHKQQKDSNAIIPNALMSNVHEGVILMLTYRIFQFF